MHATPHQHGEDAVLGARANSRTSENLGRLPLTRPPPDPNKPGRAALTTGRVAVPNVSTAGSIASAEIGRVPHQRRYIRRLLRRVADKLEQSSRAAIGERGFEDLETGATITVQARRTKHTPTVAAVSAAPNGIVGVKLTAEERKSLTDAELASFEMFEAMGHGAQGQSFGVEGGADDDDDDGARIERTGLNG